MRFLKEKFFKMWPNHQIDKCPMSKNKSSNLSHKFCRDRKISPNLVGCPTSEGAQSDSFYCSFKGIGDLNFMSFSLWCLLSIGIFFRLFFLCFQHDENFSEIPRLNHSYEKEWWTEVINQRYNQGRWDQKLRCSF